MSAMARPHRRLLRAAPCLPIARAPLQPFDRPAREIHDLRGGSEKTSRLCKALPAGTPPDLAIRGEVEWPAG